ncbi:hypothetical protein OAF43_00840 [bacterium]|nr:hypothetical protein [bacterium]
MKPPTPEQRVTETQQKLAELKRQQEELEREADELQEARKRGIELHKARKRENKLHKARKREKKLQEARKREYELTTDPTLTNGPTFWFKHAWWIIIIFGIFALGVLINWMTDGELITWLEPSR